jgi:hypothetical protein
MDIRLIRSAARLVAAAELLWKRIVDEGRRAQDRQRLASLSKAEPFFPD